MSTLSKRATGPQSRMLRIVSGAVLNAAHAHPNQFPDEKFARSVAKRAVGTLSAQWPEVLAAGSKPPSGNAPGYVSARRGRRSSSGSDGGGASQYAKARSFFKLCAMLGKRVKPLRMSGDFEAADAVRAAITALAPLVRRERGKVPTPARIGISADRGRGS